MQRTSAIHIGALAQVDDLPPDAKALPEPNVVYDMRRPGGTPLDVTVEFVFRREDGLVAHARDGEDYPITGTGAYILCPRKP